MSINSPEWWGVLLEQTPGQMLDGGDGGYSLVHGRPVLGAGVPWVNGGGWITMGPPLDDGEELADMHPLVVLARRVSQRTDGWGMVSSAANPQTVPGPVVVEWVPYDGEYAEAPVIDPMGFQPPLTWRGIGGNEAERDVTPLDGLWLITPPMPASEWSGGVLRVADAVSGAQTFVDFEPFVGANLPPLLLHIDEIYVSDVAGGGAHTTLFDDGVSRDYWRCVVHGDVTYLAEGGRFAGGLALAGGHVHCQGSGFRQDAPGAFTVELWVNPAPAGSGTGACYLQIGEAGVAGSLRILRHGTTAPHRLKVVCETSEGSVTVIAPTAATQVSSDAWHHVALTLQDTGAFTLYVDGQIADSADKPDGWSLDSALSVMIGSDGEGGDLHAVVDEVRISEGAVYDAPFTPPSEPFEVDTGGEVQRTRAVGQYALNIADDSFDWVVWLTHSDAVVSDASDKPLVRDTSPFEREIRGAGLTRTAQVTGAGILGNAIQIGDQPDARVYAVAPDPSLNFRGHPFTLEARISRQSPRHPLHAYADCCLFWFGTWSLVLTARGSLAVRLGRVVRSESGAVTVFESDPGLVDLSGRTMPMRSIALTRSGAGICTIWLDGEPVAMGAFNPPSTTEAGLSGPSARDGLAAFTRFDEVRWTNGLCRYTEPYTPDLAPFPDHGGSHEPPPAAVLDLRLESATSHSLVLAWEPPVAGGEHDGFVVEWAPAGTDFAESLSMQVTAATVTLVGLPVATAFDVRVFAFNASGPGPALPLLNVSTTALTVPGEPVGLNLAEAQPTALTLGFALPEFAGDRPVTSFVVEASLAGANFAVPVGSVTVPVDQAEPDGTFLAEVGGLLPLTGYDLRVAAVSEAGRGPWASLLGNTTASAPDAGVLLLDDLPLEVDGLVLAFLTILMLDGTWTLDGSHTLDGLI